VFAILAEFTFPSLSDVVFTNHVPENFLSTCFYL